MSRELLTIKELSAYLKIPIGTLYHFAGGKRRCLPMAIQRLSTAWLAIRGSSGGGKLRPPYLTTHNKHGHLGKK